MRPSQGGFYGEPAIHQMTIVEDSPHLARAIKVTKYDGVSYMNRHSVPLIHLKSAVYIESLTGNVVGVV